MANEEPIGIIELEDNLADIEKPPELPNGNYVGEVQDVQAQVAAGSGNSYFSVRFVIPADQIPADIAEHYEDGATLYWNRQLNPAVHKDRRTLYNLRRFIEALGLDSKTTSIDPNEWMGQRCKLVLKATPYQGEMRQQIASIEALEAPAAKAAPAAAKRGRR